MKRVRSHRRHALLPLCALVLLAGCATETLDVRVTERYWEIAQTDPAQWSLVTTSGATPGHGDTIRDIYFNATAQQFDGGYFGGGATLVKEVYTNAGGERGALQVIETMHLVAVPESDLHANRYGWVFGAADTRLGEESDVTDFCWRRCHVNAPLAGAWLDYGRP